MYFLIWLNFSKNENACFCLILKQRLFFIKKSPFIPNFWQIDFQYTIFNSGQEVERNTSADSWHKHHTEITNKPG